MNNEEFDHLMQQFRAASIHTAEREHVAVQRAHRVRSSRRMVPAFASLLIAVAGGVTALTLHHHASIAADITTRTTPAVSATPAVSDDALLTAVDEDLSDRVPHALAPLAVAYTPSPSASGQNPKE